MTGAGYFIVFSLIGLVVALGLMVTAVLHYYVRNWRLTWSATAIVFVAAGWVGYDVGYLSSVEEREIRTRFAELCKDAGVRIQRKVEADGYYHDAHPNGLGDIDSQGFAYYDARGFRFYEFRFNHMAYGKQIPSDEYKVVHYEKQDGKWVGALLKEPRARYHFKKVRNEERVGHKIWVTEYAVIDSKNKETIAQEIRYMRLPNKIDLWWMSMVGNPTQYCPDFGSRGLPNDAFINDRPIETPNPLMQPTGRKRPAVDQER